MFNFLDLSTVKLNMVLKPKFRKKRYMVIIVVIALMIGFSNSFQFRMSDEEVTSYFGQADAPEVRYVAFDDRSVRYLWQDNHQKTTAILVHGAPGSSSAFIDYFYEAQLKEAVNLISLDRPGYGYSGYGDAQPSILMQAEAINAIVAELQLDRVILVGHSLGAPIIVKSAIQKPEYYDGLVLVAGSVDPDQEPVEWYRPWLRNPIARFILPSSLYVTNEEIFFLKDQLKDMESDWPLLDIPIIVVQGTSDQLVPKENVDFIRNNVSERNLEIWMEPGVNHFIPWNRPDLIIDGVLKLDGKI